MSALAGALAWLCLIVLICRWHWCASVRRENSSRLIPPSNERN